MSDWPHAPVHRLEEKGTYMVTCGTYQKKHYLTDSGRLNLVQDKLFELTNEYEWKLQAWAILSNHYHFIAISPEDVKSLKTMISRLHTETAKELNHQDDALKRRVWYQYYDSRITYQKSYLARLNYVHQNPVKHGIAKNASDYQWCSACWFEQTANSAFKKTVESFKVDKLNVYDDF